LGKVLKKKLFKFKKKNPKKTQKNLVCNRRKFPFKKKGKEGSHVGETAF